MSLLTWTYPASARLGMSTWTSTAGRARRSAPGGALPRPRASAKSKWLAGYGVAAVLPLAAVLIGSPPSGRGFALELASALGIVALTLLALQLVLPARLGVVARPLGAEVAVRLHRHLADVLVAAIAAHVALVVVDDPTNLALFDPLGAPWRAKAALASCAALAALIASSVLRRRLRLAYARWRGLHATLGIGALGLGVLHAIGVDRYLTSPAGLLLAALAGAAVLAGGELRELRPGTRVLLDGPHGSFRARPHADRVVLIVGGIGITPAISLLRSAADAGDRRPFVLVYGSLQWEQATFREELERLEERLDLRVVHVLTDPHPGWQGESGFIYAALLRRQLPYDLRATDVLVCGPPPMLAAALDGLRRLGVSPENVHAEQFVTV